MVQQDVFAGERFRAALDRLADREGHEGHQRYLVGQAEVTDRYELRCGTCERPIATMTVQRRSERSVRSEAVAPARYLSAAISCLHTNR